ncbi:hypothetical protein [Pseudoxanthomonas dokdonensis]|uniref:Uncharacterized protein n=1 Tax=Pseudoxanthomonas dokdonensis TaxID=344882 RepID=A0A0R0CH82_9GAMM|nr:hypothetical protein [Pseudoxanthomonas dokdonensis]KRG69151.1 hypothetical protein ABB29_12165 [Pseudoxanthomonas dokdonensis]
MNGRIHPLHSSVARERLHRIHGMDRMIMTEEQREVIEDLSLSIFTDMVNTGQTFQAALSAIYLSGLQHAAKASGEGE